MVSALIAKLIKVVKYNGGSWKTMNRFGLKVTPANLALLSLFCSSACPVMARSLFILFRTVFGTLYPAYASYKAVKTKNVREYVKWMMYWIVFAFFTCTEDITDIFLAFWFPFYYEIKILILLWLLSPTTNGSSILYRKFVHPQLMKREDRIDECIEKAKADGYNTVAELVTTGGNLVTRVVREAAIPLVNRVVQEAAGVGHGNNMHRSYSTNDINAHDGPTRDYYRPIGYVDEGVEITDLDSDEDFSLGSTASGVRKDDLSSGYSGSESLAQPVPSTSNSEVDAVGSRNAKKSTGRPRTKAVSFEGNAAYATLPRTTKRSTRKKVTNDK